MYIILPFPNADGPWSLSHTFAILRGDFFRSTFAHDYMGFYNLPYVFGWLTAPLYALFAGTDGMMLSIFIINLVWIVLFIYGSYLLLKKQTDGVVKWLMLALAFVLTTYTYSLRCEIFLLPFMVLMTGCLEKLRNNNNWYTYGATGLLIAIIGLCHPVAGMYAVFFSTLFAYEKKVPWLRWVKLVSVVFIFVAVLYLPVVLYDFALWEINFFEKGIENVCRSVSVSLVIKFFSYNIPLLLYIIFLLISVPREKRLKELIYWMCFIGLLMVFGRSYYYIYLYHFALWRSLKISIGRFLKWAKFLVAR